MEKRIIIASVISVLLILGWGYLMPHVNTPAPQLKKPAVSVAPSPNPGQPVKAGPPAGSQNGNPHNNLEKTSGAASPANKIAVPLKIDAAKSINLDNKVRFKGSNIKADFNVPGGSLSHLRLLDYSYSAESGSGKVDLANSPGMERMADFLPSGSMPSPVKLISVLKGKDYIGFVYNLGGKFILTKKYIFSDGKYLFSENVSVKNISSKPLVFKGNYIFSSSFTPPQKNLNNPHHINLAPIVYLNKKAVTPAAGQNAQYSGDISFAGFNSKYFLFSAVAPGKSLILKYSGSNAIFETPRKAILAAGAKKNFSLEFYGGPKKLSLLNPLGHDISSTLNFGFFGFFSKILLRVLVFFYGFVHNYGIAIMLLVLGIRLVFYPLTYTGFKSMKQMQKLTPKINELREKYKDDKAALNKKIMELYKESKVNPFGGCLPMVLQIPVFYGLYQTLLVSIQLRNAPFAFWIHNLSAQDPYYVLPILMGISMFVSQKMNPAIGDPTQAKIMLILPIVFTFIFVHFPAGLLLYWTVNNILTIAQQYIINRKFA